MAKTHDLLYEDLADHTPERRARGDAALNDALRLRPDLPEVHLAAAAHFYYAYREIERARIQIAIAAQTLPPAGGSIGGPAKGTLSLSDRLNSFTTVRVGFDQTNRCSSSRLISLS
jgi:hypothetical protein